MIHIVYAYDHPKGPGIHYFSGIFGNQKDAEDYLASLAPEYKTRSRIESFPDFDYPLYLIEKNFREGPAVPITRENLAHEMAVVHKLGLPDDHEHFNYYLFLEDYRGVVPGQDNMGNTDHHHVDTDQIKWLIHHSLEVREVQARKAQLKAETRARRKSRRRPDERRRLD